MTILSPNDPKKLLCLGFGRIAETLVRKSPFVFPNGFDAAGTTRNADTAASMRNLGVAALSLDQALAAKTLRTVTHILVSIPPADDGDLVLTQWSSVLRAAAPRLEWAGYLSTTGVYGDLAGRWAFEWSPVAPVSAEGRRRALAERQWLETYPPAHVFRLPGLYGHGRSAFERLRDGTARRIIKPGQVFSRAHEEDVAAALLASIQRPHPGRVYNICDDEPAPPQEVTAFAAGLLGMASPPDTLIEEARLPAAAQRFYAESKRVSNARAKAELGWRPRYPSYREGLTAILAAGG